MTLGMLYISLFTVFIFLFIEHLCEGFCSTNPRPTSRLFTRLHRQNSKDYTVEKAKKIKRHLTQKKEKERIKKIEENNHPHATFRVRDDSNFIILRDGPDSSTSCAHDNVQVPVEITCSEDTLDGYAGTFSSIISSYVSYTFTCIRFNQKIIYKCTDDVRTETLHKALSIPSRKHRKKFLEASLGTKTKRTSPQMRHTEGVSYSRDRLYEVDKMKLTNSINLGRGALKSTFTKSTIEDHISNTTVDESIVNAATKLRKKSKIGIDSPSRLARRNKRQGKQGDVLKGGTSSLKEGFRPPQRVTEIENILGRYSSYRKVNNI